jgi:hypothetical protein
MARAKDARARVRYVLVSDLHYDGVHDPTDEELRAFYEQEKASLARPAELAFTAATVPYGAGLWSAGCRQSWPAAGRPQDRVEGCWWPPQPRGCMPDGTVAQ